MEYYKIFGLDREPFSNSPDPELFYPSKRRVEVLHKLEIAIRLKRGLSVVLGDVGIGKTTLCRHLIQALDQDEQAHSHLLLDPYCTHPREFLEEMYRMFTGESPSPEETERSLKEAIQTILYERGVERDELTVLIIDEGQRLQPHSVEILRELLNYETNTQKLLQIVVFGQREFEDVLAAHANFSDRINYRETLQPFSFSETRAMIQFRLEKSQTDFRSGKLFTLPALWAVHKYCGGSPRRIIHLCHRIFLALIMQNRSRVTRSVVRACARQADDERNRGSSLRRLFVGGGALAALVFLSFLFWPSMQLTHVEQLLSDNTDTNDAVISDAGEGVSQPAVVAQPALGMTEPIPDALGVKKAEASASRDVVKKGIASVPAILGKIRVQSGDSLSFLVLKVYGLYNSSLTRKVFRENASLDNANRLFSGTRIAFPVIKVKSPAFPEDRYWISLGSRSTLAAAYELFRKAYRADSSVFLMSALTAEGKLRFYVSMPTFWETRAEAEQQLDELPESLRDAASVQYGKSDFTTVYTNIARWVG